jgi:hypothetical protein
MVIDLLMENPQYLFKDDKSDLFQIADIPLWITLGNQRKEKKRDYNIQTSELWCKAVIEFLEEHEEDINDELFKLLTHEEVLPAISHDVALDLLKYGSVFIDLPEDIEMTNSTGDNKLRLTSLQSCCIKSIVDSEWARKQTVDLFEDIVAVKHNRVIQALLVGTVKSLKSLREQTDATKAESTRLQVQLHVKQVEYRHMLKQKDAEIKELKKALKGAKVKPAKVVRFESIMAK